MSPPPAATPSAAGPRFRPGAVGPALAAWWPLLLVFLFFFQLGTRDLVSSHEARAAQNAQRMLDTGEWGLPTLFDGQRDLQKPPAFYWLVAVVGSLNGGHVGPWAARLPAALAAVGCVALVYWFLRREGYRTGAVVAAVTLATANHFVAIGRTARIDVPLTFAVAVSLLAFYRGTGVRASGPLSSAPDRFEGSSNTAGAPAWFLLSALAAGFAVLLKGPVGLALIGATAVAFLAVERFASGPGERPRLPLRFAVLGVLVVGAVSAPWFVWAERETGGEFVRVFFWYHNVARFTGEADALASHPWWYYGPRFALAFAPGTLLLPLGVWSVRSGAWGESRALRFGAVWLVVMVVVLSAARFKRADYLLPVFPGAALLVGCAAERWLAARTSPRAPRFARAGFALLTVGAAAVWPVMWFVIEPAEAARQEKRPFAAAVRAAAPQPEPVLLFRTESHLLAFHLGAPLHTLVEWGELKDALATGPRVVVMPPEYVPDARRITGRNLVPVAALADLTSARPPRPLVCLRAAE